jgi:hypothetical protein
MSASSPPDMSFQSTGLTEADRGLLKVKAADAVRHSRPWRWASRAGGNGNKPCSEHDFSPARVVRILNLRAQSRARRVLHDQPL